MELFSLTTNNTVTDVQWQAYPIGVFLALLCLFTVIGNLLIIHLIIRERTLHTSKYYYIASLAFADFLVGSIVMPLAFIFEMTDDEYWLFRRHLTFFCNFWYSMDTFASTASILALSVIGLDRYVAITKPMEYPNSFLSRRWYYMLSIIWICSAAVSFPAVIHFGTEHLSSRRASVSNESVSIPSSLFKECDFPDNPYYILFVSLVSFYLPLMVMIFVYTQVYSAAKRQARALREGYKHHSAEPSSRSFLSKFSLRENSTEKTSKDISDDETSKTRRSPPQKIELRIHHGTYQNPNLEPSSPSDVDSSNQRRRRKHSRDQKAARFVGIVMGVFVFCWLPYFVYFLLSGVFRIRLKNEQNHELLFKIFSWLGYTNSALDILVYIFTSKELGVKFLKFFYKS